MSPISNPALVPPGGLAGPLTPGPAPAGAPARPDAPRPAQSTGPSFADTLAKAGAASQLQFSKHALARAQPKSAVRRKRNAMNPREHGRQSHRPPALSRIL